MRIVVDLDGVICPIKLEGERYQDLRPIQGSVEKLTLLRTAGHYIIIQTARNMATQQSNLGKVMQNVGKITLDWLSQNEVPYDEIYFGKPNADLYIDDRALRFTSWSELTAELLVRLAKSR